MAGERRPPSHLSRGAKAIWKAVAGDYFLETHQFALLEAACNAYDRMVEAGELIRKEGAVVEDRYGKPKVHPAVSVERDSRLGLARALRELGLEAEGAGDVRPPRI